VGCPSASLDAYGHNRRGLWVGVWRALERLPGLPAPAMEGRVSDIAQSYGLESGYTWAAPKQDRPHFEELDEWRDK